jgi:hypothetical protein
VSLPAKMRPVADLLVREYDAIEGPRAEAQKRMQEEMTRWGELLR